VTSQRELSPLSIGALQHLLRAHLGVILPRPTLRRVHETAGGNPFFALEITRAIRRREDDAALGEVPVPRGLDELVRERLAPLPDRTLAALRVVSAAAQPTLPLLERCLGGETTETLRPALDAHVIEPREERIGFSHPLLGSSVYRHTEPAERRSVHHRLAALVDSPEERARHLALAASGADAQVAAALDTAALHAGARGAPAVAAELFEHAIRLTPADDEAGSTRRKLDAAASHYAAGDLPRTRALAEPLLRALPPGRERARAALYLAWTGGDMALSKRRLERTIAEAEGDPTLLLGAHYFMAYATLILGGVREARRHVQVAVELAEEGPDEGLLAQCLAAAILMDTLAGRPIADEVVERALALEARNPQMPTYYPPSLTCGQRAMLGGRFDEARALMEGAYRRVLERGDEIMVGGVRWHQVELECRAGNWQLAARYAAEGYEATEAVDFARQTVLLYANALIDAHLGRVEKARMAAERALELCRVQVAERSIFGILSQAVLGFLELSLGNDREAVRLLRPLPDELAAGGFGEPSLCTALPDLIEALVELGELDEAERFLLRLEAQAHTTGSVWARALAGRCHGLVAAAEGELKAALSALERALEEHERLPEPFERARSLLALGSAQRRAKRKRAARETLGEALATFEHLGATIWARRASREFERISGRAPSRDELTPTERRVVELVAEGRTNQEVAASLFVSPRTVEFHLRNVFRKLDVHSRAELVRRFASPVS
jgi:DNA-binding CsgD family transcriptional regulator